VSDALLCAAGLMLLALLITVGELIGGRRRSLSPAPPRRTAHEAVMS
jgi:hypothetical protein